jgi:hypothetical protein
LSINEQVGGMSQATLSNYQRIGKYAIVCSPIFVNQVDGQTLIEPYTDVRETVDMHSFHWYGIHDIETMVVFLWTQDMLQDA